MACCYLRRKFNRTYGSTPIGTKLLNSRSRLFSDGANREVYGRGIPSYSFPSKVVLPNGNVHTERSSFEAGVYKGDMRQEIAKAVSHRHQLRKYWYPIHHRRHGETTRPFRQTTVHTSAGVYTEKDAQGNEKPVTVRHGLSGVVWSTHPDEYDWQ